MQRHPVSGQNEGMNIAVLLSGGVDSSAALWLAKKNAPPGSSITAFYLKIWLEDEVAYLGNCPWEEDLAYARAVCAQAGVELEIVPLQTTYFERVVDYALAELRRGRTPSPDIFCNQRVKFGAFFESAGADYDVVVSGHYAQVLPSPFDVAAPTDLSGKSNGAFASASRGPWKLLRSPDPVKDQSYFLSHLDQAQLSRLWFPVGAMQKSAVRQLASGLDLPNKDRKDSQGICFLGKIRYPDFVRHYLGTRQGNIVELDTGKVLGTHDGFWFHTIGQRSGLGLGNGPWYVVGKNAEDNVVFVSHLENHAKHLSGAVDIGDISWIAGPAADPRLPAGTSSAEQLSAELRVKLRHGPELVGARAELRPGGLRLHLDNPDAGAAPGQFAVLYHGEECLGSGAIVTGIELGAVAS